MSIPRLLLSLVLTAAWSFASSATPGTAKDVYVLSGVFVTPDAAGRQVSVLKGVMVVKGDTIECLAASCPIPPGAARIRIDDGFIYPGFIDAHQHMTSNIAPLWPNTRTYGDRYQWQRDPDHLAFMAAPRKVTATEQGWCDAERFAEIRQIVTGVTTIQGTGANRPCTDGLVRNADGLHDLPLPADRVVQNIPDVRNFNQSIDWTRTRCLAIHLGEGVDDYARQELDVLEQKGLLRPETLIIHATAFGPDEFARIAKAGARVVWSPQSNIALYGRSMNVEAAIRAGVTVSLGVDWSPSGSHDLLAELKVAERVNHEEMHDAVGKLDWLSMITSRPADALSLGEYLGRLSAGKKADMTILRKRSADATSSLLKNELSDVEMVWIGGTPVYGDASLLRATAPRACEAVSANGAAKLLCIADDPVNGFGAIQQRIEAIYPSHATLFP